MIKSIISENFKLNNRHFIIAFLFLFLLSGFSGLIYESIWTHYLKLIFGHAAYAQSLVLSIFMGGLAIGAYIASRLSSKITNPLLAYAMVEAIIGVFALFFHEIFIFCQDILFKQIAPNIDSNLIFTAIKWSLGILLILPQSILLGTTFPLISSGLLKLSPLVPGRNISLLYFNNSFGAAMGALVSGFFLIQTFGLPGTILTAGLINISIAFITILLIKNISITTYSEKITQQTLEYDRFYYLMLGTAFFTGLASFFYEIAWIRMLTLVLGATTHAFELMISAFILGLALGSLWIKQRIDQFKSPVTILAYIQLLMATFALLTLSFYDSLFDIMEYLFRSLNRTEEGYGIYILINHVLALIIMLPATFFAGMTLPLITKILFQKHHNEKVVGHVYAINTLGSIIGIVIAMNLLMPLTGTKGLVSLGGLVDLAVGLTLFGYLYYKGKTKKLRIQFIFSCIFSLFIFQTIYHLSTFNPLKSSAGVFRSGVAIQEAGSKVLFHKEGKLSTVSVIESPRGNVVISNNGKPDAGIMLYDTDAGPDEVTMILLGALPIAINPEIKTVANIGMGSGQTVQTLLSYDFISKVDSIEIEESVIDALPAFQIYSQLPRYDERSNIIIDDAKSFFASSKTKYDLIVSEPPNPWVSGVASLFTTEFYSQIKNKLTDKGILTQWLHLYEINLNTVSSVIKAVSKNFNNYALYNTDDGDIIIIAADYYDINQLSKTFLNSNKANKLLKRIKIESTDSIRARYIGNKKLLDPLFSSSKIKTATDYYPHLSYEAGKSLFLQDNAKNLTSIHNFPVPINQMLMNNYPGNTLNISNESHFLKSKNIIIAKEILKDFTNDRLFVNRLYSQQLRYSLKLLSSQLFQCQAKHLNNKIDNRLIVDSAFQLVTATTPYLGKNDLVKLWREIQNSPCYKNLPIKTVNLLALHKEIATHNFNKALKISKNILQNERLSNSHELNEYLFATALISAIKTNNIKLAINIWNTLFPMLYTKQKEVPMSLRLLLAHLNTYRLH